MIHDKTRIENIEIEDIMKKSYLEYSLSVIVARALPDVRDGLKPSQRRILYAMKELNLIPGRGFRKCAKIAGDTSGNYHPHGEQVIYPTLVRMAQPWSLRYMLIDGQGNFGSQDGDPPAAMRYTEARLQKASVDLMDDIDKDTVDFQSNYDDTRKEPVVFPSKFPNLLVNGSSGIAVGMATNMPPHNVTEVCNAINAVIDNPDLQPLDMMKYISGPDFPTGAYIIGRQGIRDYFLTGSGRVIMRGKTSIETKSNGAEQIIITEIPYQLNKTLLIDRMVNLVKEKRIEGISDIRDESGRQGMRLIVAVKRNHEANSVLNELFKYTQLQDSFSVNNRALVNGIPKVLNVKELIDNYIEFRHEIVVRRTKFELDNAEKRLHILEGYRIALDNIDEIIATIRSSKNTEEANLRLREGFGLSEIQAKAILEMRLQKLTGLEREKVEQEYNEIVSTVKHLKEVLDKKELRMGIIKKEVNEIIEKYNDERRTTILDGSSEIESEDMIADEDMVVSISHLGYIKRMPIDTYKSQRRGGKGLVSTNLKDEDFVENIFVVSTHAYIMFFTNFGKCYWLKVYQIPKANRLARGKAIVNLIQLEKDEKIKAFVTAKVFDLPQFVIMITKNGLIKKTPLLDYSHPRSTGIIAIKLLEGDELKDALISNGNDDIILATKQGYANRFNETDVRPMGRASQGVRGISLRKGDEVIAMVVTRNNGELLSISENGFGKRTTIESYKVTKRGSKGVKTIKTTDRNGNLVSVKLVLENDHLIIATKEGMIIRQSVSSISCISRNTMGVKLINLNNDDKVYDISVIPADNEEEDNDNDNGNDEVIDDVVDQMTFKADFEGEDKLADNNVKEYVETGRYSFEDEIDDEEESEDDTVDDENEELDEYFEDDDENK
ncbi:MAG: DNA gyrase subunit A [Candidatus Cloacimonetes bacterium]|nr:DNA gyrase subunit A [Candidatus Cloacimonadota bacterium]